MKRGDSRTEGFVGFKEVAEVGGGVAVGCPERGALVVEAIMLGPLLVHGVDPAIKRVKAVVARHAGREDAVEHIDTACNGVEDVFRVADTHEVASFVFGQQRGGVLDDGVLHLGGFTDTDSTDGDSVKGEVGYVCRAFLAHIEVHSALDDSEDGLTLFTRGEVAMRPFGYGGHWSSIMLISTPSWAWIWIDRSGVRKCLLPSRWDLKVTPSSVTSLVLLRDITW